MLYSECINKIILLLPFTYVLQRTLSRIKISKKKNLNLCGALAGLIAAPSGHGCMCEEQPINFVSLCIWCLIWKQKYLGVTHLHKQIDYLRYTSHNKDDALSLPIRHWLKYANLDN